MDPKGPVIGLLGGGQLGRMLCEAAAPLNVSIAILDTEDAPAKQINQNSRHVNGSFKDPAKVKQLAAKCDILTVEIEHIDTTVLEDIERNRVAVPTADDSRATKTVAIHPSWQTLRLIQNKYDQKERLREWNIPVAEQIAIPLGDGMLTSMRKISDRFDFPWMLKARRDAYDGRGNLKISSSADLKQAATDFASISCYAERWVSFELELAVVVIRTQDRHGNALRVVPYPVVETIHEDSICSKVFMPPRHVSTATCERAQQLACDVVKHLAGKGVFAVEMFLTSSGDLLVNEIAPRVHNSGHMTIETVPYMSQFKAHITSILDRAIPEKLEPSVASSVMINILGGAESDSHLRLINKAKSMYDRDMEVHLHLYGKKSRPSRKIGHITITSSVGIERLVKLVQPIVDVADEIRRERLQASSKASVSAEKKPLVLVTMGSDSDLVVLKPGIDILKDFGVSYEMDITSAHRTPERMGEVAAKAASQGIKVIIAAAGGAAHLPGMVASHTVLPVIGVPVKATHLDGHDSLLSIVQMPKGVPVATVGINNSVNAALLAIRIVGNFDKNLQKKMSDYQNRMKNEVVEKARLLKERGVDDYLQGMVKK
ncbi:MAG: hypothetical protein L6R36_008230 [Xanthoria steineri]|nr:MAG: hypothetical protein L6R36_008230 [Xanthoria steineri]